MTIVQTRTIKEFIEVVKWALEQNISWQSGDRSSSQNRWHIYGSKTCIIIKEKQRKFSYCRKDYALEHFNCNILNMSMFESMKESLRETLAM